MKNTIVSFVTPVALKLAAAPSTTFLSKSFPTIAHDYYSSSTSLSMGAEKLVDYTSAAVSFFSSVRVPSALIAGASLSSLFSLVKLVDDIDSKSGKLNSRYDFLLARVFHALCLASLILSLNVIVTATTAATMLLLENHNGLAANAYEFMNREIRYEFVTTRWSFLTCLLSFIASIAVRTILEFDLLKTGRRKLGLVVVLSMSSLMCHLLSYVNGTLYCWSNLGEMTLDVFGTILKRAFRGKRNPLELLSVVFAGAAAVMAMPWFGLKNSSFFEDDDDDDAAAAAEGEEEEAEPDTGLQDGYASEAGD